MASQDEKKTSVPADVYDKKWIEDAWGDSGGSFKDKKGLIIRPRIQKALDMAELSEGMKILDVGCGRGEIVFYALQHNVSEAVGVDYAQDVITLALETLKQYPESQAQRAKFIQSDVKKLDLPKKYFDRIFLLDIVEHLHDWELDILFQHLSQSLKDDGYLVIHTLPNKWVYDYGYRVARAFFWKLPKDPRGEKEKIFHINEQTLPHLSAILKKNRFHHTINLAQLLPEQARWYRDHTFGDRRDILYKIIRNPVISVLLRIFAMTPLKLFTSNDIYATAYTDKTLSKSFKQNIIEKCFLK